MTDIYEFFDRCREDGMTGDEAMEAYREYMRDAEEYSRELVEELEERQERTARQQDLIDLHRFER